jgi:hypothetical protein
MSGSELPDRAAARSADEIVLTRSMVTVMGPTPPGTGAMWEALRRTLSKSTSPPADRRASDFLHSPAESHGKVPPLLATQKD